MHGKIVNLDDDFAKEGSSIAWHKLTYGNLDWAPLHPNCRCTLLPISK
jgi:hypothetical protein